MDPYFFWVEIKVDAKIYGLLLWVLRHFPLKNSAWSLSSCHIITPDDRDDGRWWEFLKSPWEVGKRYFWNHKKTPPCCGFGSSTRGILGRLTLGCGALTSHEKHPKMYPHHGIPLVYTCINMSDLENHPKVLQTFLFAKPRNFHRTWLHKWWKLGLTFHIARLEHGPWRKMYISYGKMGVPDPLDPTPCQPNPPSMQVSRKMKV